MGGSDRGVGDLQCVHSSLQNFDFPIDNFDGVVEMAVVLMEMPASGGHLT